MTTMLDHAIRQAQPEDRVEPREITARPMHGLAIGLLIGLCGWVGLGWLVWLLSR